MMLTTVIFIVSCIWLTQADLPLPYYIKPCARNDPNFNRCALQSAKEALPYVLHGDKTYHIPPLDPLEIKEVTIADGGPNNGAFNFVVRNVKVRGLKDTKIEETNFDFDKKHINYAVTVPLVEVIGEYHVKGRILLLSLFGTGSMNLTLVDLKVTYDHGYILEPVDGNLHISLTNPVATVTPTMVYIHQSNLFSGDERLNTQVNEFLNKNWRELYKELQPAILKVFNEVITMIISGLDREVPFDVAFPLQKP